MRKFRPRLRVYMLVVYALTPVLLLVALAMAPAVPIDPVIAVILFVFAATARARPVHVGPKTKVTVEETATFASALLLPPFVAGLIAGLSHLAGGVVVRKRSLYNRLFNACAATIATTAAALAFRAFAPADGAIFANAFAVPAAAVANYVIRTEIVDSAVSLQIERALFASWWHDHRRDIGQQIALFALGTLAAMLSGATPLALALFAMPTFFVLLTLRETTKMRAETKAAIIELADLIDRRDRYTYGHSLRVADLSGRLARQLKLSPSQVELVTEAARVHDIGKLTTPDAVLQKPGPLDAAERDVMREHCAAGHELLRRLPEFWEGAQLVLSHHERADGGGYPRGLRGNELPIEVSIIAVCDAYDAMSSDRVYRRALPDGAIHSELLGGRGTQWAESAVDGLLAMLEFERRVPQTLPQPVSLAGPA